MVTSAWTKAKPGPSCINRNLWSFVKLQLIERYCWGHVNVTDMGGTDDHVKWLCQNSSTFLNRGHIFLHFFSFHYIRGIRCASSILRTFPQWKIILRLSVLYDSGLFISFEGGLCPWLTRSTGVHPPTPQSAQQTPRQSVIRDAQAANIDVEREERSVCVAFVKVSALRKSLSSSDVSTLMQFW